MYERAHHITMSEKLSYRGASYYGGGLIRLPEEDTGSITSLPDPDNPGTVLVSVTEIDRIYRNAKDKIIPQWWRDLESQAREAKAYNGKPLLMRLPDGSYMTVGRYLESFHLWLHDIPSDGVLYDRFAGGVIIDNPEWTDDTNSRMSHSGIQATAVAATHIAPESEHSKRLAKDAEQAEKDGFTIPDTRLFPSSRTLMKHQVPVTKVLAWRGGGILADDVGSGKSSMFITGYFSTVQYRMREMDIPFDKNWPLVIVTKNALVENTADECKHWYNGVRVISLKGRKDNEIPKDTQIIICPLSIINDQVDRILRLRPQGVIFDESHMIKNMEAKRTQGALKLSEWVRDNSEHPYIVCASATPVPNRTSELWTQLYVSGMSGKIIDYANKRQKFPRRVRFSSRKSFEIPVDDQKKFEIRYCKAKPGHFGWDATGSAHAEELSELMYANGLIRRKKSEFITPLPLLHQGFVNCALEPEEQKRYEVAEQEFKDYIVTEQKRLARKEGWTKTQLRLEIADKIFKAENSEAIMKMTALRQLSGIGKVPSVVNWIERFFAKDPTIVGKDKHRNKLIVFAHHKDVQNRIIQDKRLEKFGILSIRAGQKNVSDIVREFQDPNSGKNLIICYSEAREGLTLTAAHDVLIVEMPFMSSWILQMAGRCWARVSELYPPHEAHIHYAMADLGIDKYLEEMVRQKGLLHRTIVDGEKATEVVNQAESGEEEEKVNHSGKNLTSSFGI